MSDIETVRAFLYEIPMGTYSLTQRNEALAALERVERDRDEAWKSAENQLRLANDAVKAKLKAEAERDSLRKALDNRWEADKKAAKAIFAETGRTHGFPSVKEVVAYYVAEVERLEGEIKRLRSVLAKDEHTLMIAFEDGDHQRLSRGVGKLQRENFALRAKLERAKEALLPFSEAAAQLDDDFRDVSDIWEHSSAMSITGGDIRRAQAVLSELSADAPAQQPRDCTCHPSEAPVPCQHKYAFSECVKAAQQTQSFSQLCNDKGAVEDYLRSRKSLAQAPQISDEFLRAAQRVIYRAEECGVLRDPEATDFGASVAALRAATTAALEVMEKGK